jgi:hypothetical protein
MIQIKKVAGSSLQAAPESGRLSPPKGEWLWRISATRRGVTQQITTRSFESMQGIIALRKRAGWEVSNRIKVRRITT